LRGRALLAVSRAPHQRRGKNGDGKDVVEEAPTAEILRALPLLGLGPPEMYLLRGGRDFDLDDRAPRQRREELQEGALPVARAE